MRLSPSVAAISTYLTVGALPQYLHEISVNIATYE